jgi:hypothetical protein
MVGKRMYTSADIIDHLEGMEHGAVLCWTHVARALGYKDRQPVRRHAQALARVDTAARTVTLPSGKVLRLKPSGRDSARAAEAARRLSESTSAGLAVHRRQRAAERVRAVLAFLDDLARREAVLRLSDLVGVLGVVTAAGASRALRRIEGLTVTPRSVTLPDGRVVRRSQGGSSDPAEPSPRDDARRERINALVAYLDECDRTRRPVTLDGLRLATGYRSGGAARNFLRSLPGYTWDSDAIELPDGRRVARLAQGRTLQASRRGTAAKGKGKGKSNRKGPRAAARPADCDRRAQPAASSPAPRASLKPTAEARAAFPQLRASAGFSRSGENRLSVSAFPEPGGCLWPEGHVGEPGFHFCGAEAMADKPYCPEHAARAYVSRVPAEAAE